MADQAKAREQELKNLKEMTKQKSKTKNDDSNEEDAEATKDKNQLDIIEEEGVDLEDYLYRVYFKDEELNKVKEAQERDVFDDLFAIKQDAVRDAQFLRANPTRFDINSFFPNIVKKDESAQKRPLKRMKQDLDKEEQEDRMSMASAPE